LAKIKNQAQRQRDNHSQGRAINQINEKIEHSGRDRQRARRAAGHRNFACERLQSL
jgi:hypothetical protein